MKSISHRVLPSLVWTLGQISVPPPDTFKDLRIFGKHPCCPIDKATAVVSKNYICVYMIICIYIYIILYLGNLNTNTKAIRPLTTT